MFRNYNYVLEIDAATEHEQYLKTNKNQCSRSHKSKTFLVVYRNMHLHCSKACSTLVIARSKIGSISTKNSSITAA